MCCTPKCCHLWYLVYVVGSVSAAVGRQSECQVVLVYTTKAYEEVEV